jgi:hypothetical protein
MGRPFTEYLQSQNIPWRPAAELRPGAECKQLSCDAENGEACVLLRYPRGWRREAEWLSAAEEFIVLDGSFMLGHTAYGLHDYAYLPSGYGRQAAHSRDGAVLLVWFDRRPEAIAAEQARELYREDWLIERIATLDRPWDRSGLDPNIGHLSYARKNLRFDPLGRCRTYLLGGMPHGVPSGWQARLERHPHAEEMFMLGGDMPCSLGVMKAGAYFYRPAGIWHGLDWSLHGFLTIMRTPGSNSTVSEWEPTLRAVSVEPEYRPVLAAEVEPYRGRAPHLAPEY